MDGEGEVSRGGGGACGGGEPADVPQGAAGALAVLHDVGEIAHEEGWATEELEVVQARDDVGGGGGGGRGARAWAHAGRGTWAWARRRALRVWVGECQVHGVDEALVQHSGEGDKEVGLLCTDLQGSARCLGRKRGV